MEREEEEGEGVEESGVRRSRQHETRLGAQKVTSKRAPALSMTDDVEEAEEKVLFFCNGVVTDHGHQ